MAFETIRGESGVDFVGTAAVDALFSLNETGLITAEGKEGNDTIDIANSTGVVGTTTVKGGDGNDTIGFAGAGGSNESRLTNSQINGSKGDDTITTVGAESSKIKGNADDDNLVLSGNYSNTTINGGAGEDSFSLSLDTTLSNTKILGGADADGVMNFTGAAFASAVNSTINGSKGNDSIQIGTVTSASGFTIFGGEGNDLITSNNAGSDSVVYSGDKGDDQITTGAAKDSISGGDDSDVINAGADNDTIDAGAGADIVTDAAGDDATVLGDGNDRYTDAGGNDTITGGAGADIFTLDTTANENNNYVIGAIADSAATITGTSNGFDGFGTGFTAALQHIDITSVAESLLGDAVSSSTTVATGRASAVVAGAGASRVTARFVQASGMIDSGTDGTGYTAGSVLTNVAQIAGITATADNLAALQASIGTATAVNANLVNGVNVALEAGDVVYYDGNGTFIASTRVSDGDPADVDNNADAVADGDLYEVNTAIRFVDAGELAAAADAVNALSYNAGLSRVTSTTTIAASAVTAFVDADNIDSFADLRTALAGGDVLTASGGTTSSNVINANVITITDTSATNINGTYVIVNNTNSILDSGDLMFELTGPGASTTGTAAVNLAAEINQYGVFSSTETASAWII